MDAGVLRCTHSVQLVVAVGDPHEGCRSQWAFCSTWTRRILRNLPLSK